MLVSFAFFYSCDKKECCSLERGINISKYHPMSLHSLDIVLYKEVQNYVSKAYKNVIHAVFRIYINPMPYTVLAIFYNKGENSKTHLTLVLARVERIDDYTLECGNIEFDYMCC